MYTDYKHLMFSFNTKSDNYFPREIRHLDNFTLKFVTFPAKGTLLLTHFHVYQLCKEIHSFDYISQEELKETAIK